MPAKYFSVLNSPIGIITISGADNYIEAITFKVTAINGAIENALTANVAAQLQKYFDGQLKEFDFPIAQAGTPFQKEVWNNLTSIPYATTISYAKFSEHNPLAIRAIAAANGKNKIAIAVPCHRVIGSSGKLVGYAGGLWRKQWLLEHEKEIAQTGQAIFKF